MIHLISLSATRSQCGNISRKKLPHLKRWKWGEVFCEPEIYIIGFRDLLSALSFLVAGLWTQIKKLKIREEIVPWKTKNWLRIFSCSLLPVSKDSLTEWIENESMKLIKTKKKKVMFGMMFFTPLPTYNHRRHRTLRLNTLVSKGGVRSRRRPEGSLFNSYYTEM